MITNKIQFFIFFI